jgi:hypothetical protein
VQEIPVSCKQQAIPETGSRPVCRHPSVMQKPPKGDDSL